MWKKKVIFLTYFRADYVSVTVRGGVHKLLVSTFLSLQIGLECLPVCEVHK